MNTTVLKTNYTREIIRQAGFFMLGIVSLFYIIFSSDFAEIHIQLPFLSFPVFIGEISLFICFLLSLQVFDFRSIKGWQWFAVFYSAFVLLKALWGYILWGPLAFRHAALFYYPVFIFFGFIFYKKKFLSGPLKVFIVSLIFILCATKYFHEYWVFALWVIMFILIRSFSHRRTRFFFYAILLSAVFLSYKYFILTARTFITGNIAAVIFLTTILFLMSKIRVFYKTITVGVIFMLLSIFVFKHSLLNASGTIVDIKGTINRYKMFDAGIKACLPYYTPYELKDIKLFNPNHTMPVEPVKYEKLEKRTGNERFQNNSAYNPFIDEIFYKEISKKRGSFNRSGRHIENAYNNSMLGLFVWRDLIAEFFQNWHIQNYYFEKSAHPAAFNSVNYENFKEETFIKNRGSYNNKLQNNSAYNPFIDEIFCNEISKSKGSFNNGGNVSGDKLIKGGRDAEDAYCNSMFRLFVWRDMIVEYSHHWPIVGFHFGKPFRSPSLEIMYQASGEWERDGWIEPHNSYLNIAYRAGILGVIFIGFLIWQFSMMIKSFIACNSLTGILLCSVLINWLVAANFMPILELPYNAIPFWSLWGMTLGYLKELRKFTSK